MRARSLLLILLIVLNSVLTAQIINVPADQPTIQDGINAASNGDTVLVAEGLYLENIKFMGKAITVASHFIIDGDVIHIDSTIIDGFLDKSSDSSSTVMFVHGEDTNSILNGFTITGGGGTAHAPLQTKWGGGVYCWESGAKIANNKIVNNTVSDPLYGYCGGGGISANGLSGQDRWIVIDNNIISDNLAESQSTSAFGAGICIFMTNAVVKNNIIENNTCSNKGSRAEGAGVKIEDWGSVIDVTLYNNLIQDNKLIGGLCVGVAILVKESGVKIKNNIISENIVELGSNVGVGGGVCLLDANDKEVIVDANVFEKNIINHGAGFYERSSYNLKITNNQFVNDSSKLGGALAMFHPLSKNSESEDSKAFRPVIVNNTFVGNKAYTNGGAIRYEGYLNAPVIFNNIFWENEAPYGKDIYNVYNDTLIVSYCDIDTSYISGDWTGINNINSDPLFIDPQNDDFHIPWDSPCVAAGIDSLDVSGVMYYCPPYDFDGVIRPIPSFNNPDMGAFETYDYVGLNDGEKYNKIKSLNIYPNPFSNQTSIEFTLNRTAMVEIDIVDFTGKKVKEISNKKIPTGEHKFIWDAEGLPRGLYFLRLQVDEVSETKKLLLIK